MGDQFRYITVNIYQVFIELYRMRSSETNSIDAIYVGDVINQKCEIDSFTIMGQTTIGIHVLPKQINLSDTLIGKMDCFC